MIEIKINPLTRMMLNLKPTLGVIGYPEQWNNLTNEIINEAKKNNQPVTLLYFEKDYAQNNLLSYEAIVKKAENAGVDQLITVYENGFLPLDYYKHLFNLSNVVVFKNESRIEELQKVYNNNLTIFAKDNILEPTNLEDIEILNNADLKKYKQKYNANYFVKGFVGEGQKLGRTIGYPTANLIFSNDTKLKQGVYLVKVKLPNDEINHWGMAVLWKNPLDQIVIETNIFDFSKDIYKSGIRLELIKYHRENVKIKNLEELKSLLKKDEEELKKIIKEEV
ncbi:riboflavin kinase/FAD synthetase [Williamsoniiplasma somnilux]|uniref:riboflavin kinase n=1 Tax=Williamsoniiplasma somnilux TaxID=215578 RepID=A0A2K8NY47_9MOLU|nr:riboflavin kinase [Williamsoniiplasma somnilux]ATZ18755.1 riboflavin kinase/FAD synthetase [Williamsoniiplasma somnilux]